jgi:hypothetical protein
MAIDIGRIREYRERWQAVADRETEERRQESIYLRWRQLNAILCLAMGLGWTPTCRDEEEVAKVRRRWAVLKGADEDVAIAHRPTDLDDIQVIVENHPFLDKKRIRRWVKSFAEALGMPELWEDIAPWMEW